MFNIIGVAPSSLRRKESKKVPIKLRIDYVWPLHQTKIHEMLIYHLLIIYVQADIIIH